MPAVLKRGFRRGADAGGALRGGVPWASGRAGTWPARTPHRGGGWRGKPGTLPGHPPLTAAGTQRERAGGLTPTDPRAAFASSRRGAGRGVGRRERRATCAPTRAESSRRHVALGLWLPGALGTVREPEPQCGRSECGCVRPARTGRGEAAPTSATTAFPSTWGRAQRP